MKKLEINNSDIIWNKSKYLSKGKKTNVKPQGVPKNVHFRDGFFFEYTDFLHGNYEEDITTFCSTRSYLGGIGENINSCY